MTMRKREDEVFPNAAAVDVGASSHWVAAPPHSTDDAVHEYGVMTADLNVMADWLLACGVDTVVLESTGVYWIPVYEVLEQRGLKVWLVDARQIKYVPGRKSDVQDCQWLQKLMSLGLLRAAFRPGPEVCVLGPYSDLAAQLDDPAPVLRRDPRSGAPASPTARRACRNASAPGSVGEGRDDHQRSGAHIAATVVHRHRRVVRRHGSAPQGKAGHGRRA